MRLFILDVMVPLLALMLINCSGGTEGVPGDNEHDRDQREFSIWLVPEGEQYDFFLDIIEDLALKHGGPVFVPHITLIGDIRKGEDEVLSIAREFARDQKPFSVVLNEVGVGDVFYQCVFARARKSDLLMQSYRRACTMFGILSREYSPHLSLLYGDYDGELKQSIADGLRIRQTLRFTRIHVVETSKWLEPRDWRPVEEIFFQGDSGKKIYHSARPFTRWWWFAGIIDQADIRYQLDWVKDRGFGGVEVAFIYPAHRDPALPRTKWLSPAWTEVVRFTKQYADSIGLGCDFTFGTLWPFGGTFVNDRDRTKVYGDPGFKQPLRLSWTHPDTGNVIDHLNRGAFERYAGVMGSALEPALAGSTSALFCDSWEVETRRIWTDGFGEEFEKRFGYRIEPLMDRIYDEDRSGARYDYMKLVSGMVIENFYLPFTRTCHKLGALSRVQCAGSPTDLITAYSCVDIPETEAMLFEPGFARIVSSAAALASKSIVSSETFTCLYGFPGVHLGEEQARDLKLVADALFAHGVNQIIWHGMPYNPRGADSLRFYATVHVGRTGSLSGELLPFNDYMTRVSQIMRRGRTYSDVAVYLPLEDAWIEGEYPEELRMKWSWGAYELRYIRPPEELEGYHPLWINSRFLSRGHVREKRLVCGDLEFSMLWLDVDYLDTEALDTILGLARQGFPIFLKKVPREPGKNKSGTYRTRLEELFELENVSTEHFRDLPPHPPLIEGEDIPDFWCRVADGNHYLFFSHPAARDLTLPLTYGGSSARKTIEKTVVINLPQFRREFTLEFEPCQSILIRVDADGIIHPVDIEYIPKTPEAGSAADEGE